jgi:hypothetical protein
MQMMQNIYILISEELSTDM